MFLREHTPDVISALNDDLALVTVRCSCEYIAELSAFDEVKVKMRLGALMQNRMTLLFEYWKCTTGGEQLVARGEQQVACMRRREEGLVATPVPETLRQALQAYT
jgi:enediyne biosynthesis thioesterase